MKTCADCGMKLTYPAIVALCPLHAAAEEMAGLLREVLAWTDEARGSLIETSDRARAVLARCQGAT